MPHLEVARSHGASPTKRWIEVYRSADVPQHVSTAFRSHPLRNWARYAGSTVSLSDVDAKLALRGLKRVPELTAMQGLLVNIQAAPDHVVHCLFYGERGADTGLARSLLHLAALLAHERVAKPAWPVATPAAPAALTTREREVLDLAMKGASDAEVARTLGVAKRTIRFHLTNARHKTGVSTRAELIASTAQQEERRRR
jgi:DNA-binding CsgD family transcriptional regulator